MGILSSIKVMGYNASSSFFGKDWFKWGGGGKFNSFKIVNFKFESFTTEINGGT